MCSDRSDPACRPPCCNAAATWCIPTRFALNLAVAGALVLYDRLLQHGRFAERPVGSRGATASLPVPARHGPPRFRRNIPAWVADETEP